MNDILRKLQFAVEKYSRKKNGKWLLTFVWLTVPVNFDNESHKHFFKKGTIFLSKQQQQFEYLFSEYIHQLRHAKQYLQLGSCFYLIGSLFKLTQKKAKIQQMQALQWVSSSFNKNSSK